MPSSANVDERVVQMRMDNEQFEKGAERTIGTLEKLKKALHIDSDNSGLESAANSVRHFSASNMLHELDKITARMTIVQDVTRRVFNEVEKTVKNLTIDQVSEGWTKYEEKNASIQTIVNSTGKTVEEVSKYLDELMWFSDETSFSFTEMTSALAQMTSTGSDIEKSIPMIMGIGNAVAYAGKSGQEFVRTIRNLNQSYSAGYLTLTDWRSMQLAGTNSKALTEIFIKTAEAMGKIKEGEVTLENFTETLKDKWADKEVMEQAFRYFAEMSLKAKEMIESPAYPDITNATEAYEVLADQFDEIQSKAALSAQQAKSFKEMLDAIKDAVSTGWMRTVEKFFGNLTEATDFWTEMYDRFDELFVQGGKERNSVLDYAFGKKGSVGTGIGEAVDSWARLEEYLKTSGKSAEDFKKAASKIFSASSNANLNTLIDRYGSLENAFRDGAISADLFRQILAELNGETAETAKQVDTSAKGMGQGLDELRKVALEILRGDHGNGEERRKWLEEMGYDYELMQAMAGDLLHGGENMSDEQLMDWMERYYRYNNLEARLGAASFAEYLAMMEAAAAEAEHAKDGIDNLYDSIMGVAGADGEAVDRGWEFRQGLLNIMDAIIAIKNVGTGAFESVFGDAEKRGETLGKLIDKFYEFTTRIGFSEDALKGLQKILEKVLGGVKIVGKGILGIFGEFGKGIGKAFGALDDVLAKIGRGELSIDQFFNTENKWIQSLGKGLETFKRAGKLAAGIFGDLFNWVKKIFTGRIELPENLRNSEGILGKIAEIVTNIIDKVSEFTKNFNLWDSLNGVLDYIEQVRQYFKGGGSLGDLIKDAIGQIFNFGSGDEPKGILGIFSRLFGGFKEDSDDLSGSLLTIEDSMDGFTDSVRSLDSAMTSVHSVMEPISNLFFGDPDELEKKMTDLWGRVKKIFVTEYGKINWDTLLDIGKFGLIGYLITKLNGTFSGINKALAGGNAKVGTIRGLIGSLQGVSDAIKAPFLSLSKAITNSEKADRYLKIAAAIGILALSIYELTKIDEQKFFNVAIILGILMLIMAKLANAVDGFQLFSNNTKNISKNNSSAFAPVMDIAKNMQKLSEINIHDISLLPRTMGILLGVAALVASLVYAIIKLKDIVTRDNIDSLIPTFITIGSILLAITVVTAIIAAVTKESKYLGKAAWVMLAMVGSLYLIVSMIKSFAKMGTEGVNYDAMQKAFWGIIILMVAIAGVMLAVSTVVKGKGFSDVSGGAVIAIAGVMLAIGILIRSLVKSIDKASKIKDLWNGLAIIAALFLGLVVVLAIMSAIVDSNKDGGTRILKIAGSMLVLALAVGILTPAIMLMAGLPATGLIAAAGAIGILVLALAGAIWILGKVPVGKLLAAAVVFGVIAAAIGIFIVASGMFVSTMINLVQIIPWDQMSSRLESFRDSIQIILPTLWKLSAIALITGTGVALLGFGILAVGAAFVVAAVGILIGAYAIKVLGSALKTVGEGLPTFVQGLVNLYDTVDQNGWKIIVVLIGLVALAILIVKIVRGLDFSSLIEKIGKFGGNFIETLEKLIEVIRLMAPKFISLMISILGMLLTALIVMMPMLADKLVQLIVSLINSVADSIRAHRHEIIAAFGNLVRSLFELLLTAVGEVVGTIGGGVMGLLKKIFPEDKFDWGEYAGMSATETAQSAYGEVYDFFDQGADAISTFARGKGEEINDAFTEGIVEDARSRPGGTTYLKPIQEEIEKEAETIGDEVGPKIADSIVESTETALTGTEDAAGAIDPLIDSFSNFGELIPMDQVEESLSKTFGGSDMLNFTGGLGEGLSLESIKGFVGGVTGTEGTASLEGVGISGFNIFGNAFNDAANGTEGTSLLSSNTINGLFTGLIEKARELLPEAGATVFDLFKGGYDERSKTGSPSKVMMEEGYWAIVGLANGIIQNANVAESAGETAATGLIDEFRQTMEKVALIASDDFDYSPTITPVVDLSNAQSAAGLMNGMLSRNYNVSAQMTGNISRRMSDVERVASGMETRAAQNVNSNDIYNINIYAAEGMDEEALADAVMERMGSRFSRRGVAFG